MDLIERYAAFLVRFWWIVILCVLTVTGLFSGIVFKINGFPSFDEPTKGFETRGTDIKGASIVYDKVVRSDSSNGLRNRFDSLCYVKDILPFSIPSSFHCDSANNGGQVPVAIRSKRSGPERLCGQIYDWSYQFVFKSLSGDLFTKTALQDMHRFVQAKVNTGTQVVSVCYYVASLSGTTCDNITETDVQYARNVLTMCAVYYHSKKLDSCTSDCTRIGIPPVCCSSSTIYTVLHNLADNDFYKQNTSTVMKYSMAIPVNFNRYNDRVDYFKDNFLGDNTLGDVKLVGLYMNVASKLFNSYIITDSLLFVLAIVLILFLMSIYIRSVIIPFATLLAIIFSFLIAFFLYHVVFQISIFPFMNLLALLIVIAIGADDVFVFYDIWDEEGKVDENIMITERLRKTLKHAGISIFVTSFTTASALLANYVSQITALKLFSVFAATCVLVNLIIVMTWIPAIVVLSYKLTNCFSKRKRCGCECMSRYWSTLQYYLRKLSLFIFDKSLPFLVNKLWMVWILVFFAIGIGGILAVFYKPALRRPSSKDFKYFPDSHIVTQYDLLKDKFDFLKTSGNYMGFVVYWGVENKDGGNHNDPDDLGQLTFNQFDMSSKEAQVSMLNSCNNMKNDSFLHYQYRSRPDQYFCWQWAFKLVITSPNCLYAVQDTVGTTHMIDISPCCRQSYPVDATIYKKCTILSGLASSLLRSPVNVSLIPRADIIALTHIIAHIDNILGTPVFDTKGNLKAFVIKGLSNTTYIQSYDPMDSFYNKMYSFTKKIFTDKAPSGLRNGWAGVVSGYGEFYDLQKAMYSGTYRSFGITLGVALVVMFSTTLNIPLTVYALLTMTLSIFSTIGVLVLLGWELNILESIAISLAVGLSIDFSIHYSVAYRLTTDDKRADRVHHTLSVIGSAVTMAAVTTFVAGASLMGAHILVYLQLGTFLMLVMVFSWSFATFFFLSICHVIGPVGKFGQIYIGCLKRICCRGKIESNLLDDRSSSLSGHNAVTLEHHSLESIQDNSKSNGAHVYSSRNYHINSSFCDDNETNMTHRK